MGVVSSAQMPTADGLLALARNAPTAATALTRDGTGPAARPLARRVSGRHTSSQASQGAAWGSSRGSSSLVCIRGMAVPQTCLGKFCTGVHGFPGQDHMPLVPGHGA